MAAFQHPKVRTSKMQDLQPGRSKSSRTSFFTLPFDIRIIIYEFILVSHASALLRVPRIRAHYFLDMPWGWDPPQTRIRYWDGQMLPTAILQTNSTIYNEAMPILYKFNTFYHRVEAWSEVQRPLKSLLDYSPPSLKQRLMTSPDFSMLRSITFDYLVDHTFCTYPSENSIDDISHREVDCSIQNCLSTLISCAPNLRTFNLGTLVDWSGYKDWARVGPGHLGPYFPRGDTAAMLRTLFTERLDVLKITAWGEGRILSDYVEGFLPAGSEYCASPFDRWPGACLDIQERKANTGNVLNPFRERKLRGTGYDVDEFPFPKYQGTKRYVWIFECRHGRMKPSK